MSNNIRSWLSEWKMMGSCGLCSIKARIKVKFNTGSSASYVKTTHVTGRPICGLCSFRQICYAIIVRGSPNSWTHGKCMLWTWTRLYLEPFLVLKYQAFGQGCYGWHPKYPNMPKFSVTFFWCNKHHPCPSQCLILDYRALCQSFQMYFF